MSSVKVSILVVDDEPTVADLPSEDLLEGGYNYITAATGEDSLRRLFKSNSDVILLYLKLPGISGIDENKLFTLAGYLSNKLPLETEGREG